MNGQTDLALESDFRLSPDSPLGNHPEDVHAWNHYHAEEKPKDTRQTHLQFDNTDTPLFRMRYNKKNIQRKKAKFKIWFQIVTMVAAYYKMGGKKTLNKALTHAMDLKGMKVSKTTKTTLKRFLMEKLEEFGVKWDGTQEVEDKKSNHPTPSLYNKNIQSSKHGKPKSRLIIIRNLAFAIIKGRKPQEGFGMKINRNDEGWKTFEDCHWDNCKVQFQPRMMFLTVFQLLQRGIDKTEIVRAYDGLLHRHHALAVDEGQSTWLPSGIISDLRRLFQNDWDGVRVPFSPSLCGDSSEV